MLISGQYRSKSALALITMVLCTVLINANFTDAGAYTLDPKGIKACRIPLFFIRNDGQTNPRVKFYETSASCRTFFTEEAIYQSFRGKNKVVNFELTLEGTNAHPVIIGEERLPGIINYFKGDDRSDWRSDIPTYACVRYKDVAKNMDIKFYRNYRQLEYDLVIGPGGDPADVKFSYKGIDSLWIADNGDLVISVHDVVLLQKKPRVYQTNGDKKREVEGIFTLLDESTYSFTLPTLDTSYSTVIDPIIFSTFLGDSATDRIFDLALDDSANIYLTGVTESLDFPTEFPIQPAFQGIQDAFVTKLDASGHSIVYSTYLGGRDLDCGAGIAVDRRGCVYVVGSTSSEDFPLQNPIQPVNKGNGDLFITKINRSGNILLYSTYLGGLEAEIGSKIAVDDSSNAYITGETDSKDFPVESPYQPVLKGSCDAFVAKITPYGERLVYSTFLGGHEPEIGFDIAVDSLRCVYITGLTMSRDFPTQMPLQAGYGGGIWDAFVTKLGSNGAALVYSTYLGGGDFEYGYGIAVNLGEAYIVGGTGSEDFPLRNPLRPTLSGESDAFVAKLKASGDALAYSTYLGGKDIEYGYGLAVNHSGEVYVTGGTASSDFPLQLPVQLVHGGQLDAFVSKISTSGSEFLFSSFLGGSHTDQGWGIVADVYGNAILAGDTRSADFPTYEPFQFVLGGDRDGFIAKINPEPWEDFYIILFENIVDLSLFRQYRDQILARDKAGNLYTKYLYENSAEVLAVFKKNPELTRRARKIVLSLRKPVQAGLSGKVGLVHNGDEIAAFLESFSKKCSYNLNIAVLMLQNELLAKKKRGETFLGFLLK